MKRFPNIEEITPIEYERQVKAWLESVSTPLEAFSATHSEGCTAMDGEYEIDIVARFTAFAGAHFVVVVECKKHKHRIKRDVVQVLQAKQRAMGAQKAMIVSTAGFQSGAIDYAQRHGIALIQIVSGAAIYIQASVNRAMAGIPDSAEDYAGLFYWPDPELLMQPFTSKKNYGIADFIDDT